MYQRIEGTFETKDSKELFYQSWEPVSVQGTIVLVHGFAEHSDCYDQLVAGLESLQYKIWAYDMRGHGRSPGARGYVKDFSAYVTDLEDFVEYVKEQSTFASPLVVIAHSMGGLVTLRSLIDRGSQGIDTVCLSAPFLDFAAKVPVIKDFASRILARIAPTMTLDNGIILNHISRDPNWVERSKKDFYRHEKISPPTYLGMVENMAYVRERSNKLTMPLFFQVAGDDKIVSTQATCDFFNGLQNSDKQMIIYKDSYHEIFNDLNREEVYQDLISYILKRASK